jgi:galactokinase/mevalonate kinase-like predicted kinase
MKLLRIKDNTQIQKAEFSVADKTLEQLEKEGVFVFPEFVKEAEDITKDQVILQSINDSFRSGNVMGFLGSGYEPDN